MKMIKQVKIFRDLVGENEVAKEERLNDFLKEIYDDLDVIENFVTQDGEVNKAKGMFNKQHSLLNPDNYIRTASEIIILSQYTNHYQGTDACQDQPNKIKGITSTCSVCGQKTTNYNWEFTDLF